MTQKVNQLKIQDRLSVDDESRTNTSGENKSIAKFADVVIVESGKAE